MQPAGGASSVLTIHYHRDFDGMVSAAILAKILASTSGQVSHWAGVNYDQRQGWDDFARGLRFAVVDFHFHPRAEYWFDHHPTTFLTSALREAYAPSDRWRWDESSPSCPPIVLAHAREHWGFTTPERFEEMARWSNIVDAAQYTSVEQALFGDAPALRISRALAAAPERDWSDALVGAMIEGDLDEVARRSDVERAWQRAVRNRDKALLQFPPTVLSVEHGVVHYDASSNAIRRERFAAFFHFSDALYSVGVIPTRAGFHVTAGQNPWNAPERPAHIGTVMEGFGGGGHRAVGGANAPSLEDARRIASSVAEILRQSVVRTG
jgi:hypothetical protein